MKKVLNVILSLLKFVLLFVSFALILYIILVTYQRLGKSIIDALDIFIPYIILLLLLLLNHVLGHKYVTSNIFYNMTCCLVFALFIFVSYRTIFDDYMILSLKNSNKMNFYYFSSMIPSFKALLYLLIAGNISLLIAGAMSKKVDESIEVKEEVKKNSENKTSVKTKSNKRK